MKHSMNYILLLLSFVFSTDLVAQVTHQQRNVLRSSSKSANKSNVRLNTVVKIAPDELAKPRKIMTSNKLVWVFSTVEQKGHWSRPRPNEIKNRLDQKADFLYPVLFNNYKSYKEASRNSSQIPLKTLEIEHIIEHPISAEGKILSMKGVLEKTNIYYHKSIQLGHVIFAGYNKYDIPDSDNANVDHIIVTDTLHMSSSGIGFGNTQRRNRGYIKIIANCVIYESPIRIYSASNTTDFVFSAKEILLKTPYNDLQGNELSPPPPFVFKPDTNVEIYLDPFKKDETLLMNRLVVNIMQQVVTQLNGKNNSWEQDNLLLKFQTYRFKKINKEILVTDSEYEITYNTLCNAFDDKYEKRKNDIIRDINGVKILVEGDVNGLPEKMFSYYTIPSIATVLPITNENTGNADALGSIAYNPTSEDKLTLKIGVELHYAQEKIENAGQLLKKEGFVLQHKLPISLISIEQQPLKINGKVMGTIIPIGNKNIRLEIDLAEGTKSLMELFPKEGTRFNLEFLLSNTKKVYTQTMTLKVEPSLLSKLDYEKPLESFNVIENSTFTDFIKVSSQLSSSFKDAGALDYVEVNLEFIFQSKTVKRGPFRFSSQSTEGSQITIPFVKLSDDYSIKVSGIARYEDGQWGIEPFIANSRIIVLEEGMFK